MEIEVMPFRGNPKTFKVVLYFRKTNPVVIKGVEEIDVRRVRGMVYFKLRHKNTIYAVNTNKVLYYSMEEEIHT